MKRDPEYWIFVNSTEDIPSGATTLYVTTLTTGEKIYSLKKPLSDEISDEILAQNKSEEVEILAKAFRIVFNEGTINKFLQCPPHLFRTSPQLRIIYCEKRGKYKPV